MDDLSPFQKLVLVSPSPSKEDLVCSTDGLTIDGTTLPSVDAVTNNVLAEATQLDERIKELWEAVETLKANTETLWAGVDTERATQETLQSKIQQLEQNMEARLAPLNDIAIRVLVNTFLAVKGYRPSCGERHQWVVDNIDTSQLLPPTGISTADFLSLIEVHCDHGDRVYGHRAKSLGIALAVEALRPRDDNLCWMFNECLGHTIEAEIAHTIPSTLVSMQWRDGAPWVTRTAAPIL